MTPPPIVTLQRIDMSALCCHYPKPSTIWFLTSLRDGLWHSLRFSVPSPLSQSRHVLSSDQPILHVLFSTHPPSTTSFLITLWFLFFHTSLVSSRSQDRISPSHIPSFNSSHSCLAAHFFHKTTLTCFSSIFSTSCVQTTLIPTTGCQDLEFRA